MDYSDFSTLINLALTTVIYSTFLAPNLKKLSDLREEVADTEFPPTVTAETMPQVKQSGLKLKKKITQYSDKYTETKRFLVYFYIILALVFGTQFFLMVTAGGITLDSIMRFIVAVLIVIVLAIALWAFMVSPGKIKSMHWLNKHGIGQAYYRALLNPELVVNHTLGNIATNKSQIDVTLSSDIMLTGYSYVVTVENPTGTKLYAASAGTIGNNAQFGTSAHAHNGSGRYHMRLMNGVTLKPAKYVVRFEFFEAPFPGTYYTSETTIEIDGSDGEFDMEAKPVIFTDRPTAYEFKADDKYRVSAVTCEDTGESDAMRLLLTSPRFVRHLRKSRTRFSLYNKNGTIDKQDISQAFTRRNIILKSLLFKVSRSKKKRRTVKLLNQR